MAEGQVWTAWRQDLEAKVDESSEPEHYDWSAAAATLTVSDVFETGCAELHRPSRATSSTSDKTQGGKDPAVLFVFCPCVVVVPLWVH